MSSGLNDGVVTILVCLFEFIMRCFRKKGDARQAVEQDIAAQEFSWDDPPRGRW